MVVLIGNDHTSRIDCT